LHLRNNNACVCVHFIRYLSSKGNKNYEVFSFLTQQYIMYDLFLIFYDTSGELLSSTIIILRLSNTHIHISVWTSLDCIWINKRHRPKCIFPSTTGASFDTIFYVSMAAYLAQANNCFLSYYYYPTRIATFGIISAIVYL
jgi:hypothetical protein